MQTTKLDWLNKMPERINLMIMSPERSKIQVRSCTSRRHSPGVIPILSASTRRNAETDWYPTVSATASVLIAGFFNSLAAGLIRRSVNKSRADRPSLSWKCLMNAARDMPHKSRSEEHTSELQSLMRISYAVFCLKKKKKETTNTPAATH